MYASPLLLSDVSLIGATEARTRNSKLVAVCSAITSLKIGSINSAILKCPIRDYVHRPIRRGIIGGRDVFKEVSIDLSKRVFDSDRGHWPANKKNELYPGHGSSTTEPYSLNWYRFIEQGAVCGKILVDVGFAGFFLTKLSGMAAWPHHIKQAEATLEHS
ncbi:hypothetical protein BJY52DRAFT_1227922 [Lactarius psammicola]|nr:hypothetical protein BJY52DRAFT_1227922 [Lactarius psammicola]